jgi:geranylgeranylglycerol-phosphate geranylgeranyltransferase
MLSKRIRAMIRIFRPELPLAAAICVTTGQVLAAGAFPPLRIVLPGFICGFALSSAALIFNDIFDYEVDRINAPDRPLPSGAVSRREAIALAVFTTLVGLAAAWMLSLNALLIGVVFWLIGFLYNWRFKESGLPGNLMVSASVGVTFILGAVTVGAPWSGIVWTFALMAFFFDLGEEIAGDAMDMEGDTVRGSRSIALLRGREVALRITMALWRLVLLLSLLPVLLGWLGAGYLVVIMIMDGALVYFSGRLSQSQTPTEGRKAMRSAYLSATLGVIAFLFGRFIG